ncbi:S-layer protein [Cytobacillus firmus]|uniref:S-layer protein n=1 Tax=Cytobacillus firmus TaxID=1399 RepID=UPI0018CDF7AB|nr:S-layer protein [Cytobacillus firmus]
MSKKKAIKLAAASAVAASAFVAAAPAQTDAASNVAVEVSKAVTQMKKAYHTYSDVTANGEFAPIADVYKEYNAAKVAYKNAKALVTKAGGEHKEAYLAQLDATYNEYIAKRVVTYIDAYNYATALEDKKEALEAALEEKEWDKAEELYHEISYELKTRTVILHRVYGQTARELLVDAFKLEAQDTRDSITNEVSVKMYYDKAADLVAEGDLEDAKDAMDHVADYVAKLDKDTDFGAALLTQVSEVKAAYEAKLAPAVESVSAINLKQVKVVFNKKLDKTTAEDETKYLLNNAALADGTTAGQTPKQAKAELQADGQTVVLTLADAIVNDTALTFKVDGVKDVQGKEVKSGDFAVTVKDTVLPTVTSVEYTAGGKVVFNFSEFLNQSVALSDVTVRVNGTPVAAGSLAYGTDGKSVEATVSLTKGSTNSVYIAKAEDLAGNEMPLYNGSVVAPNDTTAPSIQSVSQVGQNTVRFVFSEALSSSVGDAFEAGDITVLKGTSTFTNGAGGTAFVVTKNTSVDSTGKTYDVTLDLAGGGSPDFGIYAAGASSQALTILVGDQTFADVFGNDNSGVYSQSLTLTKDTAGPTLVSSKVSDDKQTFEFKFNEEIDNTPVAGNVTVVNSDGVLQTVQSVTRKGATGDDAKTLVVDIVATATAMTAGSYTITLGAATVEDALGNDSAAYTQTLTVGSGSDTVKPTAAVSTTGTNEFTVAYSEEVTGSALNTSSYSLDGAALPAGTTLVFTDSDKDTVLIKLPTNSINIGSLATGVNGVLTVKNVADKAGNVIDTANHNVTLKDNTAATLTGARLLGDTLELTFDENIGAFTATDLSGILAEFEIKGGTTALADGTTDTLVTSVSNNKLTITVTDADDSNWAAIKSASAITVETDGPTLTDANGVVVKDNVKVTVAK